MLVFNNYMINFLIRYRAGLIDCPHKQIEASENSSKTKLADAALKAWVAINLLEEPVDTEVVIAANNDNS